MSTDTETLPIVPTAADDDRETGEKETGDKAPGGLRRGDTAVLVVRVAVGAALALHGAQKLLGWWDGPGRDGTEQLLTQAGYPQPGVLTWVLSCAETVGGIGLLLGALTPLAAAAVIGVLINAVALKWGFEWRGPWFENGADGVEPEVVLGAGALAVALAGAGRLSVDSLIPGLKRDTLAFGLAGIVVGVLAGAGVLCWRAFG
ncbi:hypothetical protein SRB5_57970 [Streptomyces sp. RB5]|uniref:DoxX family protein n=1 Tax=Streptomyces smaragdinus TaxID=2585196 RepID=A0A7K0CQE0_9ACTN|nr:DoxX family protein [Streptomyces smaragdinus]MQY15611.1 hypothetical protein [Streptomyces smaragdinus]